MEKITIIGSGGSGKSTLAKKLGEKLGIKVYYLNKIWWKNEKEHISEDEFLKIQENIIRNEDSFIFDGYYPKTLDIRLDASDTIIYLDFPPVSNLKRSVKRSLTEKNDEDDPSLDRTEKLNKEYISWLLNFDKNERSKILDKLNKLKLEKRIVIIDNDNKKDLFLESIG
ncbi:DNA topology modulation protein [Anaerococcus sp. AGMB00486]|uniref:DNA topology modulation protein n=2 Tax=Anaerococcus TaxID=165779 RepID=A0ABX2NBD2_9FIRM|nr:MULTISPECIES: DNA topology modulation protein [Anaerococcus]MSS78235.1 DNA topology modulation protein [Anaerococcus porci]NVF11993.1 DNA topology modulation protein [Anaerococcus faecalis]